MTQQEGIMQDVNTFAGTDQCQLTEYGPYSYTVEHVTNDIEWDQHLRSDMTGCQIYRFCYILC